MTAMIGLLAAGATVVALFGLAELMARFWLRSRSRYAVWPPRYRLRAYFDRSVVPELEPVLNVAINSDGERGGEVERNGRADRGLYRVLVAGGSAVEGLSLDQPSNWPAVVETTLSSPENRARLKATRVHVGNIGRSGVTCQDLEPMFARLLPQYRRLDAIVLMVGAGEVASWIGAGAPAGKAAPPLPVSEIFAVHPEIRFGWRPSRLALLELGKRWRRQLLRPVEIRQHAGRWIGIARAMRAAATDVRTEIPDPTGMLDTFERCLGRVLLQARAHATRVLLVRQPWFEKDYTPEEIAHLWHGGVGHAWKKQSISVYYAFDVVNRLMALVDERAVRVAERLGVPHVDVRRVLEPTLANYYDYLHYTPAGGRKVGVAVASALLGDRLEPARPVSECVSSTS